MDPVLAADLLVVANSPLFGLRAKVQSIRHAIAMVGLEGIRSLALTIALKAYVHSGRWAGQVQLIWRHSIATAVIAESLGATESKPAPFLYTAGLIHDVGRLALLQISAPLYTEILGETFSGIPAYLEREKGLFDCSHDDAGAFLAMAWNFPTVLCDCIRFHHWEIATHAGPLFELLGIACRIADAIGYPEVQLVNAEPDAHSMTELIPLRSRGDRRLTEEKLRADIDRQLSAFPGMEMAVIKN
jgi:HD-like signal output (HDOD) protein